MNTEFQFCNTPNQHATPASLEVYVDGLLFHGYQEFFLSGVNHAVLPKDAKLQVKYELLAPYFSQKFLAKRSFLDLGANGAFYSFWALSKGAENAIAVDIDDVYLDMVNKAANLLNINGLDTYQSNIADWEQQADVVIALALVHWIYSCSAAFGSLDAIIAKLSELTHYMLIVEWIAPEDEAIHYFHHLTWNQNAITETYSVAAFECALGKYFTRYQKIGDVSPTRSLYVAFRFSSEIDLSAPLPFVKDKTSIISSRLLTVNKGAEYWSVVYDDGSLIYKQTSYDLAQREAQFLRQFADSEYFPGVKDLLCKPDYTLITLEKIQGRPLGFNDSDFFSSAEFIYDFIGHCLNLLGELKDKGITHRDIHKDNLIVRNGKPVLIDFGWAISIEHPYFTPSGLGGTNRPPDGSFCDVYSMGQVLKTLVNTQNTGIKFILSLMTFPEAELRQTDIRFLRALLQLAMQMDFVSTKEKMNLKMNESNISSNDAHLLLHQLDKYIQKINWLETELLRQRNLNSCSASISQALTEQTSRGVELTHKIAERDTIIAGRDRMIAERDTTIAGRDTMIAERDTMIAERDTMIAERDTMIAERDTMIAERDTMIAERDTMIAERDTEIANRGEQIQRLINSTSWLITKPLRALIRRF